jgi:hypothetical protein
MADASIRAAAKLLKSLRRDSDIVAIVAEVELCAVWSKVCLSCLLIIYNKKPPS